MKKQFLLLLASAALLASCGNSGEHSTGLSVPSGDASTSAGVTSSAGASSEAVSSKEEGSAIAPSEASAKLLLASKALEESSSIGLDLTAEAALHLKAVQGKSEKQGIPQDLTNEATVKVEGLHSAVGFENFGKPESFAQSVSASAKIIGEYEGDVMPEQGASAPEHRKASLNLDFAAKEYIEEGYSYFDLGQGLDEIGAFLQAMGTFPITIPPYSKFKTPLSQEDYGKVVDLNYLLSGYVASFALMVSEAAVASVSSGQPALNDYFVFEAYSDGRYGVEAEVDVTELVAMIVASIPQTTSDGKPNVIGQIIVSILGGLGGKASASAVYSEYGVESIEADIALTYKTEIPESERSAANSIDGSLSLKAKGVFSYGDKVSVEHVENKEEYLEIRNEDEEEEGSDESILE